jgi:hypothetical protein
MGGYRVDLVPSVNCWTRRRWLGIRCRPAPCTGFRPSIAGGAPGRPVRRPVPVGTRRPSVPAEVIASVLVLQTPQDLSDAEAIDALRWKVCGCQIVGPLCSLRVLADQTAETITSHHSRVAHHQGWLCRSEGWRLSLRAVRPASVVVLQIAGRDPLSQGGSWRCWSPVIGPPRRDAATTRS